MTGNKGLYPPRRKPDEEWIKAYIEEEYDASSQEVTGKSESEEEPKIPEWAKENSPEAKKEEPSKEEVPNPLNELGFLVACGIL